MVADNIERRCSHPGCDRNPLSRNSDYCRAHTTQFKRHGSTRDIRPRYRGSGCSEENCDLPHKALGLCDTHYNRSLRSGYGVCSLETCDALAFNKTTGLCAKHYTQDLKGLELMATGQSCRFEGCPGRALIHGGYRGWCLGHKNQIIAGQDSLTPLKPRRDTGGWRVNSDGYVVCKIPKTSKVLLQHRVVMEEHLGRSLLPWENVHHINGVRDDNRIENLELWSKSQPPGQRVEDKANWAIEILKLYRPEVLREGSIE